jgi:O-antigen ligase
MGYFLLLLYLVVSYLSPDQIYPELAQYRIELLIVVAAVVASVPAVMRRKALWGEPQTRLLVGLLGAMILSQVARFWFGGIAYTVESFMPVLVVFFLIGLHVNSLKRMNIVAIALVAVAFFLMGHALWDLYTGNVNSPYLLDMKWDLGRSPFSFFRIRAVGGLSDPNDFAQFLLVILPFVAVAWRHGRKMRNFFFVVLPSALILYGVYLTHSRGALVALVVLTIMITSRRVPFAVSAGIGGLLFGAMILLGFSGGRDVSVSAGADRIDLWGMGLAMFRSSPIWGIGYGKFLDHAYLTAHNSYVLCLAEIGFLGYTLWLATVVITILELHSLSAERKKLSEEQAVEERAPGLPGSELPVPGSVVAGYEPPPLEPSNPATDADAVRRWARALKISMIMFLVTAWFLSRTYAITLYVVLGMTVALINLTADSREESKERRRNWIPLTAAVEFATITAIYLVVRFQGLLK